MLALVVKCTVCYYDVVLRLAGLVGFVGLRSHHDQGQLGRGLPELVLLCDFLSVGEHVLILGGYFGLGTLGIVDLVAGVVTIAEVAVLLLLLLDYSSSSEDVEPSLSLSHNLPILMLLQTDVLLLVGFLGGFGLVDRLGVGLGLEAFAVVVGQPAYLLLGLLVDVDLGAPVELGCPCLRPLPLVGVGVVYVGVFLAVLVHRLRVLLSCQRNYTAQFTIVLEVTIRR